MEKTKDGVEVSKRTAEAARLFSLLFWLFLWLCSGVPEALARPPKEPERTFQIFCLTAEPPFLILKDEGEPSGFFVDLVQSLAKLEDMAVNLRVGTWEDLRQSLYRGKIDVIVGAPHPLPLDREPFSYMSVHNGDAAEFAGADPLSFRFQDPPGREVRDRCFSMAVAEEPYSILVRRNGVARSVRDFEDMPLIARRGSDAMKYLNSLGRGLGSPVVPVFTGEDALQLVSTGVYPGALIGIYQGLFIEKTLGLRNLDYLSPPLFTQERGIVVTRGDSGLAMRIGRALEVMKETGAYGKLAVKWFGGCEATVVDLDLAIKIASVFLAVLILIGGWNLMLKQEVARITREREEILDFIRDGIVAVDRSGRISMINKVAQRLLGVDESALGQESDSVIPEVDLSSVLRTREPIFDMEQNLNGSLVIANMAPVILNGAVWGAIATFRDMTEIHALAQEITGVKMYVESLRVQNHEFQNKLQAIAGLIHLGRYDRAIEFITDEASLGGSAGFISENIKNPAVGGILMGKVGRCRELGIDIRIDPDSFCGETRTVSDQAMVVIVGNLLQNGMEAVLASKVENPRIDFAIFDESNRIMISVADNGGAMTEPVAEAMFTRGFSTKAQIKSSGLGLYNVKKLVDAMGGDLSVEYVTGDYTEFTVSLPNGGK